MLNMTNPASVEDKKSSSRLAVLTRLSKRPFSSSASSRDANEFGLAVPTPTLDFVVPSLPSGPKTIESDVSTLDLGPKAIAFGALASASLPNAIAFSLTAGLGEAVSDG